MELPSLAQLILDVIVAHSKLCWAMACGTWRHNFCNKIYQYLQLSFFFIIYTFVIRRQSLVIKNCYFFAEWYCLESSLYWKKWSWSFKEKIREKISTSTQEFSLYVISKSELPSQGFYYDSNNKLFLLCILSGLIW